METFLTEFERNFLRLKHRQERNRQVADRIKAVLLSDKGWSYRQISYTLLLDEQTISRHVEDYRKRNKLKKKVAGLRVGSIQHFETSWVYNE